MRRENKKRITLKKINRTAKIRIAIAAAACLLVAGVSFTVYSKYYKTGYNPGMAIASGFYFSSNHMSSVTEIMDKSMDEIARDYRDNILVSTNRGSWKGTEAFNFDIEVRNYDNQLLYNDKDLNVDYEVSFMLIDYPVGAIYSVSRNGVSQTLEWENGKGVAITYKGRLEGGKPNYDSYTVGVAMRNPNSPEIYEPASVLVVARPTGPSFLTRTKWIAGILKVNYEEKEFRIEDSGFAISKNQAWETAWKNEVEKEAGYIYQVYTTGNNTGTGTRKRIYVRWKKDLFTINAFDTYYKQVEGDSSRYYEKGEWQVMEIDVLPYASLKFVFYRNSTGFTNAFKKITNKEEFEETVQVTADPKTDWGWD